MKFMTKISAFLIIGLSLTCSNAVAVSGYHHYGAVGIIFTNALEGEVSNSSDWVMFELSGHTCQVSMNDTTCIDANTQSVSGKCRAGEKLKVTTACDDNQVPQNNSKECKLDIYAYDENSSDDKGVYLGHAKISIENKVEVTQESGCSTFDGGCTFEKESVKKEQCNDDLASYPQKFIETKLTN